jgi:hypothetical protein
VPHRDGFDDFGGYPPAAIYIAAACETAWVDATQLVAPQEAWARTVALRLLAAKLRFP